MKKIIKAFTLLEVMVSIFIFTTSMLGYMAFNAYAQTALFESDSTQFASALAFNLIDELNSISCDAFKQYFTDSTSPKLVNDRPYLDSEISSTMKNALGNNFKVGPHSLSVDDSYKFYRKIEIETYQHVTNRYVLPRAYLNKLYHIRVGVFWPKFGNGGTDCSNFDEDKCNVVYAYLVRSNSEK